MSEIWMISPYASPSEYGWHSRTFIMSKDLKNRGHKVTVFSFTGSHYLHLKDAKTLNTELETHEDVAFKWFKSVLIFKNHLIVRIINWQIFNFQMRKHFRKFKGKTPDSIVFSIPSLSHVRLMPLAKKIFPKAKLIFEIRDLWPLSIQNLGNYANNNLMIQHLKSVEKLAFELADSVIAVQPRIFEYIDDYYSHIDKEKVHFIPHAYVPTDVDQAELVYDIGYGGTLSRANDVGTLLKSLQILKEQNGYEPRVLIMGTGIYTQALKKAAENLKNVHFFPWVNRDLALKELAKCTICYDGLLNIELYKYGFSRLKWVDYMLLKKPILVGYSGSDIDVEIDEIGWKTEAENTAMLAKKIRDIFNGDRNIIQQKGINGFNFLKAKRNIAELGKMYETILLN